MELRVKKPWEYASAAEEIEALRAEVERLREDVERFRQLAYPPTVRLRRIEDRVKNVRVIGFAPGQVIIDSGSWDGVRAALEEKEDQPA